MDTGWRNKAAQQCLISKPTRFLDLCCGTGDLVITMAKKSRIPIELFGVDYSQPMLDAAASKARSAVPDTEITFANGDASRLPFPDSHFDCVGISFAFRNLTYKNPLAGRHLSEVLRVLKPGGAFVIVESSQPVNLFVRRISHLYLRLFVGPAGSLISGNRGAYHYLAESARQFFTGEELKHMLITTGFNRVTYRPLFFGAAGIHVATK